jgi:hypothetical protein
MQLPQGGRPLSRGLLASVDLNVHYLYCAAMHASCVSRGRERNGGKYNILAFCPNKATVNAMQVLR